MLQLGLEKSDELLVVPRKIRHYLRDPPFSNKRLMKFYYFAERDDDSSRPLPSFWTLLMPNADETIRLDGMTVSLQSGKVENVMVSVSSSSVSSSNAQESFDDAGELNMRDKSGPVTGADNTTSSQNKVLSLTTETAEWDTSQECIPMADWQTTFHPSCNSVHEMDVPLLLNGEAYSLVTDKGFWRNAWKIDLDVAENGMSPVKNIVIKSLKYIHEPSDVTFELNRVDGVSMEQLTHSRHITDIYGYCGTTSLQEYAGGGLLGDFLRKKTPVEKLGMAAYLAAGLADIHDVGCKGDVHVDNAAAVITNANDTSIAPSLIHNDINLANILIGERNGINVPLINDFNTAIFRKKDAALGAPCRFRSLFVNPQWMAPEQMQTEDMKQEGGLSIGFLNEKIDVYALGNILYFMVVGNPPWKFQGRLRAKEISEEFYQEKKAEWDKTITRYKLEGRKPKVPEEVKHSDDPSIQAMLTAMYMCYRSDPDNRASARKVSDYLKGKFLSLSSSQK